MKAIKEKQKKLKISKTMTFAEIMEKKPESSLVLIQAGMHCFGCSMAASETLEQGCLAHGLDPEKILEQINEI